MLTKVALLLVLFTQPCFAADVNITNPATACTAQRSDLNQVIKSYQPTTNSGMNCLNNITDAVNCCNGNGQGCQITSASASSASGLNGVNSAAAMAYSASASGLRQNATLCTDKLKSAACTISDQSIYNFKVNVRDAYLKLNTCLQNGADAMDLYAVQATSGSQSASTSAIIDGVARSGASVGGEQQQAMNGIQNFVSACMFCASGLAGDPTGPPKQAQPDLAPPVVTISGSGPQPNGNGK